MIMDYHYMYKVLNIIVPLLTPDIVSYVATGCMRRWV